jgi:NAD(P)-dependent dehydrogenase (short-subunit alcohol dehydrogenase family)
MSNHPTLSGWALILGASSGFGEATSLHLARCGMNIFGVHLDRRATLANVERIAGEIKGLGREVHFFNVNAADEVKRAEVLSEAETILAGRREQGQVKVLLHTLAFGTLKPFIAEDREAEINKAQMDMTVDVMGHSLVYWVQDVVRRKLMGEGGRVFAMTSSGGTRVMSTYGAVSAAKAALESHIRQLALELAPFGISANAVRAGVTDTPALRKIPGNDKIVATAVDRNPHHRLTTAAEVAKAIALLAHPDAYWVSGNTIGVDGGEDVTG